MECPDTEKIYPNNDSDESRITQTTNLNDIVNLCSNDKPDYIEILQSIVDILCYENAPAILGIITGLLTKEIKLKNDKRALFMEKISKITQTLNSLLPRDLLRYLPSLDMIFYSDVSAEPAAEQDILSMFRQMVIEVLIKKSKHEIWNNINVYFNKDKCNEYVLRDGLVPHILSYTQEVQDPFRVLREVVYVAEERDTNEIIEFFEKNPEHFQPFIIMARFSNGPLYSKIVDMIYSEKRYFKKQLVTLLPELSFERIIPYIKDYNWDVTLEIIQARPDLIPMLARAFHDGLLGFQKRFFLEAISSNDTLFCNYVDDLGLNFEDIVEISSRSIKFASRCIHMIENEDQIAQFCKIISKKDEDICFNFLKEMEPLAIFETFLKILLKNLRLTGNLKNYIIQKYADDNRFFYTLISYLDIETIERLLKKYYEKDVSIDALLRRYYPQEIIIEIHRFKDSVLSLKLIAECVERFDDKDWVIAMKTLETIYSDVKISTCLLLFTNKPNIKQQVIYFLKRSIGDSMWDSQKAVSDLIRCMEMLKEECIYVLDIMRKDEIVYVFRKSAAIENTVRKYLVNYKGNLPTNLQFIWNCLKMA